MKFDDISEEFIGAALVLTLVLLGGIHIWR
jgi:hypothetical protein